MPWLIPDIDYAVMGRGDYFTFIARCTIAGRDYDFAQIHRTDDRMEEFKESAIVAFYRRAHVEELDLAD